MPKTIKRHCRNPNCPALAIKGSPRFLCETEPGAYLQIKCPSCKTWWTWGQMEEVGTVVLEDVVM